MTNINCSNLLEVGRELVRGCSRQLYRVARSLWARRPADGKSVPLLQSGFEADHSPPAEV